MAPDTAAADQFAADSDRLSSHHASMSSEVDDSIRQLENILKSWNDVRAEMEACSLSLKEAEQVLSNALPDHQQDLQLESDKLQVVAVKFAIYSFI